MLRNLPLSKIFLKENLAQFQAFTKVPSFNFAATSDAVSRNYVKFKSKYDEHVKSFREKMY